ncbi:hypothetical protein Bbelb_132270 [Branchiostoma belcheri]|nr:hypothetical protein Bbelb_132270 [Branchiostoma belcheri]
MGDKERSALRPLHNTADAMGDRSQLTKKMFAWHKDPRVGRRTGIVMKKDMKKDADGFELISEYFSDTESEESSVLTEPSTKKQPKPKKDIRPRRMSSFSPIQPDSDLSRTSVSPAENPAPVENPGPADEGSPTPGASPTPAASPTVDSPTPTASPPVVENPTSADSPTPSKSAASPAQEDGTSATPEIQSAVNVSAGPEASPGLDAERNQSAQDVDVSSMNFTADDSGSISKISSQDPRTAVKPVAALKKRLTFGGASSDSPDTTAQKGSSVSSLETASSDKEATGNATEADVSEKPTKQTKRKSQRQERAKAGKPSETTDEEETLGRRGARQQKDVVTEVTENSRKDQRGGPDRATQQDEEDSSRASKKQKDQDKTAPKKVPGVKKQPLVVEMVDSDDEDDDLFCMKRFRVNLTNRQNTSTESQATKEPNADQIRTKNTSQHPAKKAKGDGQNDETAKNKKKGRPRKSAGKKNKEVDSETQPESMDGSKQSAKDLEMRQEEPESQESRLDTVVDDVQREVPSVELEVEVHHEADGDSFNHSGLQDLVLPSDREEAEDEEIPVQPSPKLLTKTRSQKRGTSSETAQVQKKFKPQPKERSNARGRRSGGQRSRSSQDSSVSDGEVQKKRRGQARKDLSSQFLDESSELQAEANSTAESHQGNTEPKRRRASKAKESRSAPKKPGKQRQEASSPVEKGPDNSLTAVEEDVPVFDLSSQTAQESATSDGEVRRRKRGRPRKAPQTAQSSNESTEIQSEANVSAGLEEKTEPKKKRAKKNGKRPGKQRQPASSTEDNSDKTLSSGDDLPVSATPLRSILKGGKNHTPRSSTSTLPRASVTSPKHYANVTQSKSASKKSPADSARQVHIIAPRKDKTPGVRRSCRNRARPVAWWAQERVVYERRDSGRVMVDVKRPEAKDYGTRPRKTQITKGKSRPRKVGATKTQQPLQQESVPNISTHTDVPRDWEDVENPVIPVVNPATKEEVLIDCVKTTSMFDFRGPQGRAATEEDGIKVCKALRQPQFGLGQIILEPRQEKGTQFVRNDTLAYVVMEGKLAVTIHRSTMKLQTGDMFLIPAGNTYNIRNLRNDRARLSFCQIKPSQQ